MTSVALVRVAWTTFVGITASSLVRLLSMASVSQNVVMILTVQRKNLCAMLMASARTVVVKVQNVPDMTDHVMNLGNRETTTVNTVITLTRAKKLDNVSQVRHQVRHQGGQA